MIQQYTYYVYDDDRHGGKIDEIYQFWAFGGESRRQHRHRLVVVTFVVHSSSSIRSILGGGDGRVSCTANVDTNKD